MIQKHKKWIPCPQHEKLQFSYSFLLIMSAYFNQNMLIWPKIRTGFPKNTNLQLRVNSRKINQCSIFTMWDFPESLKLNFLSCFEIKLKFEGLAILNIPTTFSCKIQESCFIVQGWRIMLHGWWLKKNWVWKPIVSRKFLPWGNFIQNIQDR